jgi:hypothetical protein
MMLVNLAGGTYFLTNQPSRMQRQGRTTQTEGGDIGKRRTKSKKVDSTSYNELSSELKEKKKKLRRERRQTLQAEADQDC